MRVSFLGATGTVTGSKYLVECRGGARVLVDCGLFQGQKNLRQRNWTSLPVSPASIDAVLLTHAHIDHTGYLPALVKHGFRGDVFCTSATRDLAQILLPDCGYLQEEDARHANARGYSRHKPAMPLFTREDAAACLPLLRPVDYGVALQVAPRLNVTFHPAGHILGSAFLVLEDEATRLLFSGDVGRQHDVLMRPPSPIPAVDYIVCESTYGDRLHDPADGAEKLAEVIHKTMVHGGKVVIPAFAVGRAQALLYLLSGLRLKGRIPRMPVFLDSPMAIDTSEIYCRHRAEHRLDEPSCRATCTVARCLRTPAESKELNSMALPYVVLSASGMATGGRVVHHLARLLPDARNTVLLAGFQAAGTRGRRLAEGAETVRIHGDDVPVRAHVEMLHHLSAHADRDELLTWLRTASHSPQCVFVTHGEAQAAQAFSAHVAGSLGWSTIVPEDGEVVELG